jgi:hypothetical protein
VLGVNGLPHQIHFTSSDTELADIFVWARDMANSCVRDSRQPVGPWYEASLPNRNAFCMRDTAHQCIGAALLGLDAQNENMLGRFLSAIDTARDYCSYWEIENTGRPAPVDYESDTDFWYNLPANFDVIDACLRLYELTGSETLVASAQFARFVTLSLNEYANRWQLEPELVMHRAAFPLNGDRSGRFTGARGIPSYDEAQAEIAVGADLLAAYCAALTRSSYYLDYGDTKAVASEYKRRASEVRNLIEAQWWHNERGRYYDFLFTDGSMGGSSSAGNLFLLWFGALNNPERVRAALSTLQTDQIEPLSYFPQVFYRCGCAEQGRAELKRIFCNARREYPEASFAAIEAIVCGVMGIEVSASQVRVQTRSGLRTGETATVTNAPVLGGTIDVTHHGCASTCFQNSTAQGITWRAAFMGTHDHIKLGGKVMGAKHGHVQAGAPYCFVDVVVNPGDSFVAEIVM